MNYKLDKWTMRWTENCWFLELMGCDQWDEVQLESSHWDWHWDKYYLTSSLMTWMMGQCILRSLQMTQNCDASDGYAASQTAWRNVPTGNSWSLTKADAKVLSLDELLCISTGWELTGQKDLCFVVNSRTDMRQQGTLGAKSVSNLLAASGKAASVDKGKVILPLCSALVRHIWITKHSSELASEARGVDMLGVSPAKCHTCGAFGIWGIWGHLASEKRLRALGLFSLLNRRLRLSD